jgi:hypothetical protein
MNEQVNLSKKQISPAVGAIALVVLIAIVSLIGYNYLKPVPNEPINMSPGMKKMNENMKAWAATKPWEKQGNGQQNVNAPPLGQKP